MSESKEVILEAKHVTRRFRTTDGRTLLANNDVNLKFYKGETLGLVGESGCGKSTFMKFLVSLDIPSEGEILYRGKDITKLKGEKLRQNRQHIQMVFQDPTASFNPKMKIRDIICEPLLNFGRIKKSEKEENCRRLLELVELPAEFSDRYPHNMSGGQRQRVAIARALALEPEVIIMDEATSALDVSVQKTIIELITKLQREKNITIGFICHDIALIEQCAHQIAVMYLGNVVEVLPGGQLSKDAVHPYTRALMGSVFDINMDFSKPIENLEGEAPSPLELPEGCPFQGRCTKCMAICKKEAPQMVSLTPDHQVACHLYTKNMQKYIKQEKSKVKENKSNSLIEGDIGKAILFFVLPLIAGSLIQQLYVTVDAIIVGRFAGKVGLAAIDSINTLFKFPINFMNGLAAGATIIISRYFGAKAIEHLHRSIRTAVTIAFVLGIISSFGGVLLAPQLLKLMRVPADIYRDTLTYCTIYFGGLWSLILYNMAAGILRAFGDSKRPLYVLLVSSCINILGDLLLVGVLHLGVGGAAAATVAAQIVSVVLTFLFLAREEHLRGKVHVWHLHFGREHMAMMIRTGFPLALQSMLFPIANSIVQASVNTMGTDSIAAWSICDKLNMLIWLLADSMGPAMTTYVAQNLGAGQKERVKKGAVIGTGISVLAVGAVSLFLFFASGWVGPWFIDKKDAQLLIPLVVKYMQMMAPFYLFYAIAEALSGASCGLGETVAPMITTLLSICLFRVCSIWVILPKFETMECIIWIYIASWIVAGLSFIGLFWYKSRRKLQEDR